MARFFRGPSEGVVCKFFRRFVFLASSSATGVGAAQQNGDGIKEDEGPLPNTDSITSNKSKQAGVGSDRRRLILVLLIFLLVLLYCDSSIRNDGTDDENGSIMTERLEYSWMPFSQRR
jgi:hypothetical protein